MYNDDCDADDGEPHKMDPVLTEAVRASFWKDACMALIRAGQSPIKAAELSDIALGLYDKRRPTPEKPYFGV